MTFEKWWQYYLSLKRLTHNKAGARKLAEVEWNKQGLGKDIEAAQKVYNDTIAVARFDLMRLDKGEEPDRWPHGVRFLKHEYFSREIGSYTETKEKPKDRLCGCGEAIHDNKLICRFCDSRKNGILVEQLKGYGYSRT